MYDNIDFKIRADEVKGIDFVSETPNYFDVNGEHYFNGEMVLSGYLDTLKISASKNGVKVSEGSLCKWYLGDNFQTLTRKDTQRAIEKLSDTLHLPFFKANVTRIDLAPNIIVKYEPDVYFSHLGDLNYYNRFAQKGSLYYNNPKKQIILYDKVREQKAKGQLIPEICQNRNVLRYEMRFKSRLREQFKTDSLTADLLYNESFYIAIIDRWYNEYKAINKLNDLTLNFEQMNTVKEFKTAGLLTLIDLQGGELAMLQKINEAQKKGELTKKQAFDFRHEVKHACKMTFATVKSDVIKELDQKIYEAKSFYR
jgi:hypothetical protein